MPKYTSGYYEAIHELRRILSGGSNIESIEINFNQRYRDQIVLSVYPLDVGLDISKCGIYFEGVLEAWMLTKMIVFDIHRMLHKFDARLYKTEVEFRRYTESVNLGRDDMQNEHSEKMLQIKSIIRSAGLNGWGCDLLDEIGPIILKRIKIDEYEKRILSLESQLADANDMAARWANIAKNPWRTSDKPHPARTQKTYVMYDGELYKIGKAYDPEDRLKKVRWANINANLIHVIDSDIEKYLHLKYANKRIKNEWFDLSESDIQEIIALHN